MEIQVTFPGNKKVAAQVGEHTIMTDQPVKYGGDGTAPTPYEHFLASLATCAGIFILGFCKERGIPTEGVSLTQRLEFGQTLMGGPATIEAIAIDINVPAGFPEKYLKTLVKVADQCAVKKTIVNPPAFKIQTVVR
jgi:ribosomal protein S12 methylthiotransferase accessory factor